MNYSSPDYAGIERQDPYGNMSQNEDPSFQRQQFILTPEEIKVLKECSREGIFQRAIPMGVVWGLGGLFAARAGIMKSARFGVYPAVIGLGTFGYFLGRFSYNKICIDRVLQVPNGNMRKIMGQAGVPYRDNSEQPNSQDPSNYYANIEVPKDQDQTWDTRKRTNSDIELPTTSSFDTVPSDYYVAIGDQNEEIQPKSYTSYDDLRKRNRQDFNTRMYPEHSPRFGSQPEPQVVRPKVSAYSDRPGNQQTKYGDSWE